MLVQMKKAQGETNQRLDAIADLLTQLLEMQNRSHPLDRP